MTIDVRWVFQRAFGPSDTPCATPLDGRRAVELAGLLGLVERIGARVPALLLARELGAEAARAMALARLQTLSGMHRLAGLVSELGETAAAAGVPIVLLKFAALHAGGCLTAGSRAAGDLDLLVREEDAARAVAALTARGFQAGEATLADHHHLPPLRDRHGRLVELHTRLPGVRAPGARRFAGFEALERGGLLEPAPGLPAGCLLPRRDLLAAHAIAHGLAQHGGADAYPVTRVLADVIDVLPAGRRARGLASAAWIASAVRADDVDAVLGLCDELEAGDLDALDGGPGSRPESALLAHVLASSLDPAYRRSLALGATWNPLRDEPRWLRVVKTVQCLAWPTRAQLAARMGAPSARVITPRLRLAHALALARRLPGLVRAALGGSGRG